MSDPSVIVVEYGDTTVVVELNQPVSVVDVVQDSPVQVIDIGNISGGAAGPQGPPGPTGPAGADGEDGATGPQGLQGPTGPQGPQGDVGLQGPVGPEGDVGPAGSTGPPGAEGPIGPQGPTGLTGPPGADGAQGPIGLTGPTGPEGPEGDVGPEGPAGPAGADGGDGSIILDGSGPPADSLGEVDDYYLDSLNQILYGPKAAPGGVLGPEISVRAMMPTVDEQYPSSTVSGQKYTFSTEGSIVGVEQRLPVALSGSQLDGYVVSVWSETGTTLHAQKIASLDSGTVGWHTIYFDTPFQVVPGATYMIAVGTPSVGVNNRCYCHVNQATVVNPPIACNSGGATWGITSPLTAYPVNAYGIGASIATIAPIFAEPADIVWPIAIKSGTDVVTVAYDDWPPADPEPNTLYLRLAT